MTVLDQAHAFAAMVLCGIGVGAANDALFLFRRNAFLAGAADLLLGLVCTACIIAAGLLLRCDPFRLYTLLGVAAGWAIYSLSLGTIVRILLKGFMNLSNKVTNYTKIEKSLQENEK
ncbi:MAG: hypothetical protein IKU38_04265 [Clostridia bacterium]|nr:hypothetical protein [Clostridia bacterium]